MAKRFCCWHWPHAGEFLSFQNVHFMSIFPLFRTNRQMVGSLFSQRHRVGFPSIVPRCCPVSPAPGDHARIGFSPGCPVDGNAWRKGSPHIRIISLRTDDETMPSGYSPGFGQYLPEGRRRAPKSLPIAISASCHNRAAIKT